MPGTFDTLRTDQVGSLLRPETLKAAWSSFDRGEMDEAEFLRVQMQAVAEVISKQVTRGVVPVTDGEFWRRGFQETFGASVSGYVASAPHERRDARGVGEPVTSGQIAETVYVRRQAVDARLGLIDNRLLVDYRRDLQFTDLPIKVTLIGPERITQRFDLEHSRSVYATFDEFMGDVIAIERQMLSEVIDAGCRYVQIDEPSYTAYVDPASLGWMRERNWDPTKGLARAITADNEVIAGWSDVTFGVHICRGNEGGAWHREGFYDAIAEQLFSELDFDRLLLEYDTERAGGFEPLRFIPKGKVAVLGLISTKTSQLEERDEIVRRIEQATRFLPIEQLAISPQCGFASGIAGNPLTEDDQWRKLDLVREVADLVWGAT